MHSTLMERLRIIAPLVISAFYNVLWSDSRSGLFTQLYAYTPPEEYFLSLPVTFETPCVCCFAKHRVVSFLSLIHSDCDACSSTECSCEKPHSLCHWLPLQEQIDNVVLEAEYFLVVYLALWWETDSVY
jgi:hypothetical protein